MATGPRRGQWLLAGHGAILTPFDNAEQGTGTTLARVAQNISAGCETEQRGYWDKYGGNHETSYDVFCVTYHVSSFIISSGFLFFSCALSFKACW